MSSRGLYAYTEIFYSESEICFSFCIIHNHPTFIITCTTIVIPYIYITTELLADKVLVHKDCIKVLFKYHPDKYHPCMLLNPCQFIPECRSFCILVKEFLFDCQCWLFSTGFFEVANDGTNPLVTSTITGS
jgi:hypothetical protein